MAVPDVAPRRGGPTLRAEPTAQLRLLDLQELDSRLDQLAHRRRTLPELAQISEARAHRTEVAGRLVEVRTRVGDLERRQVKADADVEQVKARRARNQERLDKGQVGSPRDLENLQHELHALDRRISTLEDEELAVMEQLEQAQTTLTELEAAAADLDETLAELTAARDAAFAKLDEQVAEARTERQEVAAGMPADLLSAYDRLRPKHSGVGAAALNRGRCSGCRLELNPADLRRILAAPEDEVTRCEECGRILVRTAEAGA